MIQLGVLKLIQGSKFPRIIGSDFAGIVKEVAPGIDHFKAGDHVYGAIPAFSGKPGASWVRIRFGRKMTSSHMRKRTQDYDDVNGK